MPSPGRAASLTRARRLARWATGSPPHSVSYIRAVDVGAANFWQSAADRNPWPDLARSAEMSESNTAVTGEQNNNAASRTGRPPVMLSVYRWSLLVFLAAGVVQIFLAGLGTFRLLHGAGDSALDPHRTLGFAMAGIAII